MTVDRLYFDPAAYELKTFGELQYLSWENITYCEKPCSGVQKMNLYVPAGYLRNETINGYTADTAPIFMPNTVGGYMEGPAGTIGIDRMSGTFNTAYAALKKGYVVACAGVRGRNTGRKTDEFFIGSDASAHEGEENAAVGKAPAFIVDMKAAIRYLRHNRERMFGDTEKIITNGTSAGGALSALTGASGNSMDYEPYLRAIGAAGERDDIFAASCYCPIHNLEHADMAYEWQFNGEDTYYRMRFIRNENGVQKEVIRGEHSQEQKELSALLKGMFPSYVNSLHLKDASRKELTLDEDGSGSFLDELCMWLVRSAKKEAETGRYGKLPIALSGSAVSEQPSLTYENGRPSAISFREYVSTITRMKSVPAFDALDLSSAENEEFGDENIRGRHFTDFSMKNTRCEAETADPLIVKMMNPLEYIGKADTAAHWRIRHGSFDRDTSFAIPMILAYTLINKGYDTDFFLPWGLPHSGDYDLNELFAWIDSICKDA